MGQSAGTLIPFTPGKSKIAARIRVPVNKPDIIGVHP
jgi:hypothetical protein